MIVGRWKLGCVLSAAATLAACSGGPARPRPQAASPAAISTIAEPDAIFDLMLHGDVAQAGKRLIAVLKRDPMNPSARLLRDSLERDPVELLGPQSHAYGVREGDTIVGLAERFLGNRFKAYQLARYNNLTAPFVLVAGQTLRIPGAAPRPDTVRRADPAPSRATASPTRSKPTPAKSSASVASPVANPIAARPLRAAGLAALNQGNVPRAVALLRRAAALDPANPLIARDLARAGRIAATVKARQ